MNLEKIKSLFLKCLIACLIAAAGLAVVTVLLGKFNDISDKALVTILLIAIHSLISFGFIVNNEKQETFENLEFFTNVTFAIIVLSFITSVLGVWGVFHGGLVARLYATYFVLVFATLHGEILAKTRGKQQSIDWMVSANYAFMCAVVLMLIPVIFLRDNATLSPIFYRILAACGIVDATLTLIVVIMHKLYVQKHPTVNDAVFNLPQALGRLSTQPAPATAPPAKRGMNIFVIILIGYVALQLIGALFLIVLGSLSASRH